ncbi:MAG: low molecular weight phosphotyrosine protein phosphatase [Planctomycetota bacterium]|nr:low molecular weight phosphotyrosine protein phosphatase [Planctomycetota bacterium]
MSALKVRVLFVCLGNICRSPSAEGIFRSRVVAAGLQDSIDVDSAGSIPFQVGKAPDRRAQQTARAHGIELDDLRARLVTPNDYRNFDYLVAMDESNLDDLIADCPEEYRGKLSLMMTHSAGGRAVPVPDPYYGDVTFEKVWSMLEDACGGLLQVIRYEHKL